MTEEDVKINGGRAMSSLVIRSRNVLKRNSMPFAAALLAVLASFVAGQNVALDAAPQHQDQVPTFYRLKVGDLEVTALFDGTGVFDPILGRHRPCASGPAAASRGHRGVRRRPGCRCGDAPSIADTARA